MHIVCILYTRIIQFPRRVKQKRELCGNFGEIVQILFTNRRKRVILPHGCQSNPLRTAPRGWKGTQTSTTIVRMYAFSRCGEGVFFMSCEEVPVWQAEFPRHS